MHPKEYFKDFGPEEFVNDESFQNWIFYPTPENNFYWKQFLNEYPQKKEDLEQAVGLLQGIEFKEHWPSEDRVDSFLKMALDRINERGYEQNDEWEPGQRSPWYLSRWAAAAILVVVAAGSYLLWKRKPVSEIPEMSQSAPARQNDVDPGGNRAILTLADGSRVVLDSAGSGELAQQGGVSIINKEGRLAYNKMGEAASEVLYNTVTTPKGGQYQLMLADGTRVWLNAASSLRFPNAFPGEDRRVELTGEGFFEVAADTKKAFYVTVADVQVRVLGTQFNINAYTEEKQMNTTLFEGSVLVTAKNINRAAVLKPGQQASISGGQLQVNKEADLVKVAGWKNGLFVFSGESMEQIMSQIARWYDVEVEYTKGVDRNKHFSGIVERASKVSAVLKILEYAGIKFRIEGKKIIVYE